MKYIIFDCDSTVGLPGKPMDDALALLYLLGRPAAVTVLGVTMAAPDTCLLNLPAVKEPKPYREEMYGGWLDFQMGGSV